MSKSLGKETKVRKVNRVFFLMRIRKKRKTGKKVGPCAEYCPSPAKRLLGGGGQVCLNP